MIVETTSGRVRGKERHGIATWRGIPYATARRFRAPTPVPPWTGERDALEFGPFAIQARDPRTAMMSGITDKTEMSEDCLVLNVYAPLVAPAKPLPVLVWIHGGAFIMGAGSQPVYNGTSFVTTHDIVVVTINYRLGLLGLLYLGDLLGDDYAEGNAALLDQIAALRWVRDNIAAFGGDPNAVTVMGESAGAISVAHLLAMPAARGLFHRAILESGAISLAPRTRADATAFAEELVTQLGVAAGELPELPVDRLFAAQQHVLMTRGLGAIGPCIDGVTLPTSPLDAIRDGAAAGVPLLLGSNRDEWAFFDVLLGPDSTRLVVVYLRERVGPLLDQLHARYRDARPDRSDAAAWVDIVGDLAFRIPAIKTAEAQLAHAPVWMYRFDWATPVLDGRLGAAHALELPFVWNVIDTPFAQLLLGDPAAVRPLADAMHATWASFIRDGRPTATPAWPAYDTTRRATFLFDRESRVADDPRGELRILWP